MVPPNFVTFFSVLAGVGATLFGLIFVTISIKPETARSETTSVMPQVQVASAYSALLNPLVISLLALVPQATIGTVTVIMSTIGLVNTVIMGISLFQDARTWGNKLTTAFFVVSSLVIFGVELYLAIRLEVDPGDRAALSDLTTLLVIIYLYGIARAWDLVGARQFHLYQLFAPLTPKRVEEFFSGRPPAEEHINDESMQSH